MGLFYFLMAATAFWAASSRLSAAVMGRPLSLRILLASCTLVPKRCGQNKNMNPRDIAARLFRCLKTFPNTLGLASGHTLVKSLLLFEPDQISVFGVRLKVHFQVGVT